MNNKIIACFFVVLSFFCLKMFAQVPQGINYQAVARNAAGDPIATQTVSIEFKIRSSTATGTVVYDETNNTSTNQFGLFTAIIGMGTPVSGNFSTISWGTNKYFIEVLVNGNSMGSTQFMSVPYALNSPNSGSTGTANYIPKWNSTGNNLTPTSKLYDDGTNVGIGITSPKSTFELAGGFATNMYKTTGTAAITLDNSMSIVHVVTSLASINFPAANTCPFRRYLIFNQSGGNINTSSYIKLDGNTDNKVPDRTCFEFISDGTNWYLLR